jgi:hypothetical protein
MLQLKHLFISTILFFGAAGTAKAQLFVDPNYTVEQMIYGFFGSTGDTISNVSYQGAPVSLAFFEGSQSNIGLNAGLLITSGMAETAVGPNSFGSAGTSLGQPGSQVLDALIPGYNTFDASIISMDIRPSTDTLRFRYVFASEEYQEYVGSQFNDVFAFFVEGPGLPQGDTITVPADTTVYYSWCYTCADTVLVLTEQYCTWDSVTQVSICYQPGDTVYNYCYYYICDSTLQVYPGYSYYSPGGVNIAQIPNTNLPVAINNLNQFSFNQYFIDNANGTTVQYDAFTTPLWAELPVTPGGNYRIIMAVADAGDGVFDSGVFLSIESIGGDSLLPVDVAFESILPSTGTTVQFDNNTFWATGWEWDFGDGTTSTERYPNYTYATPGIYTVTLKASNWCSEETFTQVINVGVSGTVEPAEHVFGMSPNPTMSSFVLELKQAQAAQVRIVDMGGRMVYDRFALNGSRVDVSTLAKGVYGVQVISNGQVYTQKLIKI